VYLKLAVVAFDELRERIEPEFPGYVPALGRAAR
jgi:hypothetical protein